MRYSRAGVQVLCPSAIRLRGPARRRHPRSSNSFMLCPIFKYRLDTLPDPPIKGGRGVCKSIELNRKNIGQFFPSELSQDLIKHHDQRACP
jgi:hypothetical protein